MWHNTRITQLLNIQYPILLGPMGAGFGSVELLAIVSNAGGLGSLGAYTLSPEQILDAGKEIKDKTDKPYNINLWVNDVDASLKGYSNEELEKATNLFKPYFDELGIPLPQLDINIPSKFEQQVEAIFRLRPAVFSFVFGVPSRTILDECRRLGIKTAGGATTLDEALLLEEAGVDAIVAAGFEGGGHRPSFLKPALDSLTGTFSLTRQLAAKIKVPVIAAGGIADGRGVAAALVLGAEAAQIGTAFLVCDESSASEAHRNALFSAQNRHTTISKALTGRHGRMLDNRIAAEIPQDMQLLPFPLHTRFLAPLKLAALEQGKTELINFWSGQSAPILKYRKAQKLMRSLIEETSAILK